MEQLDMLTAIEEQIASNKMWDELWKLANEEEEDYKGSTNTVSFDEDIDIADIPF